MGRMDEKGNKKCQTKSIDIATPPRHIPLPPKGLHLPSLSYLIQIQHLVPANAPGGLEVFHGQGEVDPSGIGQIEVIGVVLVPLLHCREYLLLISADNV